MTFQDQTSHLTSMRYASVKAKIRRLQKKVLLINSSAQANMIHGYRSGMRQVMGVAPTYKEAGDQFRNAAAESKPEKKERKMSKIAKLSETIKDKLSQ